MTSKLNVSEVNKEKMNNSQGPLSKFNSKIYQKLAKTPEMLILNNKKKYYKKSTLNSQRRKIPTINLEPNLYFQPLTLNKEDNQNDIYDFLNKKYLITISKYEQIISELSSINKKLDVNIEKAKELKESLKKLKEDKKRKQNDIVNLLSNKESLEEIYKNKVYYLIENKNKVNKNLDNNNDDAQKIHGTTDSEIFKIDEEPELEIKIEEIKRSEKKKFVEQVINFTEDIFQKNEEIFKIKIKEKIYLAYKVFSNEINSSSTINMDSIVSNFFSRIGVYISNHSLGNYSEKNVNKFLRYLLKINSIGVEIFQVIKFLNKKYKEQKNEIKEQINILNKKNENLIEKKKHLEKNRDDLEIKIEKKKENLQTMEKNKDKLDSANFRHINITSDNLFSVTNINTSKKRRIFSERGNEINNEENENYLNNLEEMENLRKRQVITNSHISAYHTLNVNNYEQKYKYLSNNETKKKVLKIKINNSNQNINNDNHSRKITKEKIETINESEDKGISNKSLDQKSILNKKIKINLEKIKGNKISKYKIFKTKSKNNSQCGHKDSKDSKMENSNLTEEISYKNINITTNIDNNPSKINPNINNNLNEINKNNRINVNNLVINNDIQIQNINDIMKSQNEDNNFVINNQNMKEKTDMKSNNSRIYYSKKNPETIKINKNNIIVNNNEHLNTEMNENIINNEIKDNGQNYQNNSLYNTNNFNYPNKQQYNKNIYIINNINNSEQYNTKNNVFKSTNYRKINISSNRVKPKTENIGEISNDYKNKLFENNNIESNNKTELLHINKRADNSNYNDQKEEEQSNPRYNFHDILHGNKKENIINNKFLKNMHLDNVKFIPVKNLDKIKIKNSPNSPTIYLQLNKKNKGIFQRNKLSIKDISNSNDGNKSTIVKKKLPDSHIIKKYNEKTLNDNTDMNLVSINKIKTINNKKNNLNKEKIKIAKIPVSSNINNRLFDSNNEGNLNKTSLSSNIKSNTLSP